MFVKSNKTDSIYVNLNSYERRFILEKLTLKAIRVNKGLTQKEAAEDIGISDRALSLYEQGKRIPRWDMLKRIIDYYGVSIEFVDI